MSPDVNDPGFRNISFDVLLSDYEICVEALIDSGVDMIFIETVFDTLNSKSALMAVKNIEKKMNIKIPVMISATITDLVWKNAFWSTVRGFLQFNYTFRSNKAWV